MKTLVVRIYLTLLAVLLIFAAVTAGLVKLRFDDERAQMQQVVLERIAGWSDWLAASLPPSAAPVKEQADALEALASRLQLPLALQSASGERVATSAAFAAREALPGRGDRPDRPAWRLSLPDGRAVLVWRPSHGGPGRGSAYLPPPLPSSAATDLAGDAAHGAVAMPHSGGPPPWMAAPERARFWPPWGPAGGLLVLLALLFVAVALAAWPVARRLTRRLEALQRGVQAFGAGALGERVPVQGRDEVAAVARAFNEAAARVEAMVQTHRSLLANASHELRSPLARLKMALALRDDLGLAADDGRRRELTAEAQRNVDELDALVGELLLASRLSAHEAAADSGLGSQATGRRARVDLLALLGDEVHRAQHWGGRDPVDRSWQVSLEKQPADLAEALVDADEALLRRAAANLLQNARRYGGASARVVLRRAVAPPATWCVEVVDQGPGVPAAYHERIFEPFFRVPGRAEHEGSTGLGLSLVRQIAELHGGQVRCRDAPEGGCIIEWTLPAAGP